VADTCHSLVTPRRKEKQNITKRTNCNPNEIRCLNGSFIVKRGVRITYYHSITVTDKVTHSGTGYEYCL
jgi:hypothetical protein